MADAKHASQRYSLAHLTALSVPPPQLIELAAQAGYHAVSLRLLPAAPGGLHYSLMDDAVLLRETLAASKHTGVDVFDLEIIRLGPQFELAEYHRFFETAAELGAKALLVGCEDEDTVRRADAFASLCEAVKPYGLSPNIEFMPWSAVKSVSAAKQLIDAAGTPSNSGLLVDALHFARSDSTLEAVRALPPQLLHYAQICDAPPGIPSTREGLIHTARKERLLPGEGGIDLKALWKALPSGLPVGVEIPNDARVAALGVLAWAKEALRLTKQIVEA